MKIKRKIMKRFVSCLCIAALTASVFFLTNVYAAGKFDYAKALNYSIIFYDANKCGNDVTVNNEFDWRGACHTCDGSDVGLDLTGGYHDAGDHVKFGLPQGYTAAVLGWSLYEFEGVFDATGEKAKMLEQLKYFTDYFLKSHPDSNTFYYQVGDGELDHQYWGSPEIQVEERETKCVADASNPASDVLGETSAALALMYLNYKDIDATYANKCLNAAKELYSMGKGNPGRGDGQYFYQSTSIYDDLAWGAIWLYIASNDSTYLEDAKEFVLKRNQNNNDPLQHRWTMCWDDMYVPALLKLAELTGDPVYKGGIEYNLDYWMNSIETTPGGLRFVHYWGVLRYAASSSMIALIYYKQNPDSKYLDFAKSQIDYILGDNPMNMSYVVGYGSNWSEHPHHRAAQGAQGYADNANYAPAKYLLLGALIGGPDNDDKFLDSVVEYHYTEVAIDYNAGFVGALAGIIKHFGGISIPEKTHYPVTTPTSTPSPSTLNPEIIYGDLNGSGDVNSTDYALLKRCLLGTVDQSSVNLSAGDVDNSGDINSTDYALMKRYLLGIIDKFPADKQ